SGRIIGASKIVRDVTGRKQAEERINDLLIRLKEADRRKDDFLAMVAHEVRNPLAPLCNILEILKRGDGNGDLIEQFRPMRERQLGRAVRLRDFWLGGSGSS